MSSALGALFAGAKKAVSQAFTGAFTAPSSENYVALDLVTGRKWPAKPQQQQQQRQQQQQWQQQQQRDGPRQILSVVTHHHVNVEQPNSCSADTQPAPAQQDAAAVRGGKHISVWDRLEKVSTEDGQLANVVMGHYVELEQPTSSSAEPQPAPAQQGAAAGGRHRGRRGAGSMKKHKKKKKKNARAKVQVTKLQKNTSKAVNATGHAAKQATRSSKQAHCSANLIPVAPGGISKPRLAKASAAAAAAAAAAVAAKAESLGDAAAQEGTWQQQLAAEKADHKVACKYRRQSKKQQLLAESVLRSVKQLLAHQ